MRGLLLLLLTGCFTLSDEFARSFDPDAHFRKIEGIGDARATPETLAALQERSWAGLGDAAAAARFEKRAGNGSADWLHASELRLMSPGKENYFLGARDAWRWLAATRGGKGQPEHLRRRAYRLYNHNVTGYARGVDWSRKTDRAGSAVVHLQRNGLARERFDQLASSYWFSESSPEPRIVTSGAGGPVVAVFRRDAARDKAWPYLHPDQYLKPLSAVLDFQNGKATLTLHDPKQSESIPLFGRTVPLKVDYTAGLAFNATDSDEGLERPDASLQSIYMMSPPDPKRKLLLFVHGFNSGPEVFRNLALMLGQDPVLRSNYQLVAYRYATGYSLFINNAMFRSRLRAFYDHLGEVAPDARAAGTVAIGHSMGGLQIKPLAQASGQLLWDRVFQHPPGRLQLDTPDGQLARKALLFEPLPEIRRLIFLAVPHRGSALASGILAQVGKSKIVEDPGIKQFKQSVVRDYGAQMRPKMRARLRQPISSVDSLRPDDPYLNLLLELPIRVPFHSVVADIKGSRTNPTGDGVVPYASAHLDGATSEKIIQWGHNVTSSPDCMAEVQRLLKLHLR